jgi:bidirectional [NiFe] hydrogenase diaphorase subunit
MHHDERSPGFSNETGSDSPSWRSAKMTLVETQIDGRRIRVRRDRWALEVAREMGAEIPSLCHHPALNPYGACRLCVVEVSQRQWTWLATACDLPIREGLCIRTDTPAVLASRKWTLELLWAAAPEAEAIAEMAQKHGVNQPRFSSSNARGKCILCGLCVRACRAVLGQPAICFSWRGGARRVGMPFSVTSDTCTGCSACAHVCPTGHIASIDDGLMRRMTAWNTELALIRCAACGQAFGTAREFEMARARTLGQIPAGSVCPHCRRLQAAARLVKGAEGSGMAGSAPNPARTVTIKRIGG